MIQEVTGTELTDIFAEVPNMLQASTNSHCVQVKINKKQYLIDKKYFTSEWLAATDKLMGRENPSYRERVEWLIENWKRLEQAMLGPLDDTPVVDWF